MLKYKLSTWKRTTDHTVSSQSIVKKHCIHSFFLYIYIFIWERLKLCKYIYCTNVLWDEMVANMNASSVYACAPLCVLIHGRVEEERPSECARKCPYVPCLCAILH